MHETYIDVRLSRDELSRLAAFFDEHVPHGFDGFLGLLHAVLVAPSMLLPSTWLPVALLGEAIAAAEDADQLVGWILRCYNDVLMGLEEQRTMTPSAEDVTACERFAAGYVTGASLDPEWRGNAERWTFAAPFAYLCGRHDLVPARMLEEMQAGSEEARIAICQQAGALVLATRDSFRRSSGSPAPAAARTRPARAAARVGRNAPCPCGSGKKHKKCCGSR